MNTTTTTTPKKTVNVIRSWEKARLTPEWDAARDLLSILSWKRPHMSEAEQEFVHLWLDKGLGCLHDEIGNRFFQVGEDRTTLWSCHTDTVHHDGGYQKLEVLEHETTGERFIGVVRNTGSCLGADDGTGLWILLNMIQANIPGLYVFHRGEEKHCIGSHWIADHNKPFLSGVHRAIAFDRRDYTNVITHQGGERGCSHEFATELSKQLGMGFSPDPTGSYTDTARYFKLVPECTNLSVGYGGAHGPTERQNMTFALRFLDQVKKLDSSRMPVKRDPSTVETRYSRSYGQTSYSNGMQTTSISNWRGSPTQKAIISRRGFYRNGIWHPHEELKAKATIIHPGSSPAIRDIAKKEINSLQLIAMEEDAKLSLSELLRTRCVDAASFLHTKGITSEDILLDIYGQAYMDYLDGNSPI